MRGSGIHLPQDGCGDDLLLVIERTEQRALGHPRRIGNLTSGDVRAALQHEGQRRIEDGCASIFDAHRLGTFGFGRHSLETNE